MGRTGILPGIIDMAAPADPAELEIVCRTEFSSDILMNASGKSCFIDHEIRCHCICTGFHVAFCTSCKYFIILGNGHACTCIVCIECYDVKAPVALRRVIHLYEFVRGVCCIIQGQIRIKTITCATA